VRALCTPSLDLPAAVADLVVQSQSISRENLPHQSDLSRSILRAIPDLIGLPDSERDKTEKFDICGSGGFQHLLRFCFSTFTSLVGLCLLFFQCACL